MDILPQNVRNQFSATSFIRRVLRITKFIGTKIVELFLSFVTRPGLEESLKDNIWIFLNSKNSYEALEFLGKNLNPSVFVATSYYKNTRYSNYISLDISRQALFFYKIFPLIAAFILNNPRIAFYHFDIIIQSVGLYEVYRGVLKRYRPKAIIFSNDHTLQPRSLFLAAKSLGIPTIYIQHASVSKYFPPLKFDLSLLEGKDALGKYRSIRNTSSNIKLVGMPKLDQYLKNKNKNIKHIGICINALDNENLVNSLISFISFRFPTLTISFRKHPRDTRQFLCIDKNKIKWSNAKEENSFEFLNKQDLVIAGNSSIHLEATALNVVSLGMNFNDKPDFNDYYGFLKKNLIKFIGNYDQLECELKNQMLKKENVYKNAKFYINTIDTNDEGKSAALSIKYINTFLADN